MKSVIAIIALAYACSVSAQGTFQNLDFEEANPVVVPAGQSIYYPYAVTAASALPGWTASIGGTAVTQVILNAFSGGAPSVDLFGPGWSGPWPGIIDGNYSVFLQAGVGVNASIEQNGTIPTGYESLQFRAWDYGPPGTILSVSFNGISLSPVVIGSGPNYTLFGVNIASYAGQTGELEFTSVFNSQGPSWNELDDITFSPNAVPEPDPLALTGIGGLLFALYRRFAPKRQ